MNNKWIKVESEFLSNALIGEMFADSVSCTGKTPTHSLGAFVHAFRQISKNEMEICWEFKDDTFGVEMGNCKINTEWWVDL